MRARDSATEERRDYAGLAGLVGFGRREVNALIRPTNAWRVSMSTASWRCATS